MDDDFNTANAISVLFELAKQANLYLLEQTTSTDVIEALLKEFEELVACIRNYDLEKQNFLDEEIESLIQERIQARKDRNFQLADQIRDELKAKNIILEDTPQGTRWKRG